MSIDLQPDPAPWSISETRLKFKSQQAPNVALFLFHGVTLRTARSQESGFHWATRIWRKFLPTWSGRLPSQPGRTARKTVRALFSRRAGFLRTLLADLQALIVGNYATRLCRPEE